MINLLELAYVMTSLFAFIRNFEGFRVAYTNVNKFLLALMQQLCTCSPVVATNIILKVFLGNWLMLNKSHLNILGLNMYILINIMTNLTRVVICGGFHS